MDDNSGMKLHFKPCFTSWNSFKAVLGTPIYILYLQVIHPNRLFKPHKVLNIVKKNTPILTELQIIASTFVGIIICIIHLVVMQTKVLDDHIEGHD